MKSLRSGSKNLTFKSYPGSPCHALVKQQKLKEWKRPQFYFRHLFRYFSLNLINPRVLFFGFCVRTVFGYVSFFFKVLFSFVVFFVLSTNQMSILNLLASYIGMGDVAAFRVLRTLRGLRPLRAMSRLKSMRVSQLYRVKIKGSGLTRLTSVTQLTTYVRMLGERG